MPKLFRKDSARLMAMDYVDKIMHENKTALIKHEPKKNRYKVSICGTTKSQRYFSYEIENDNNN